MIERVLGQAKIIEDPAVFLQTVEVKKAFRKPTTKERIAHKGTNSSIYIDGMNIFTDAKEPYTASIVVDDNAYLLGLSDNTLHILNVDRNRKTDIPSPRHFRPEPQGFIQIYSDQSPVWAVAYIDIDGYNLFGQRVTPFYLKGLDGEPIRELGKNHFSFEKVDGIEGYLMSHNIAFEEFTRFFSRAERLCGPAKELVQNHFGGLHGLMHDYNRQEKEPHPHTGGIPVITTADKKIYSAPNFEEFYSSNQS